LFALHVNVAAPRATAAAILFAVNVTAAVPLTPSNIGVFQAACIAVLSAAGVAAGAGLAYGIQLQGTEPRHRAASRRARGRTRARGCGPILSVATAARGANGRDASAPR
jgi:hypothetical protein